MDAANFIFSNILSAEMGEMEYGEDESLHFGAEYYPPGRTARRNSTSSPPIRSRRQMSAR